MWELIPTRILLDMPPVRDLICTILLDMPPVRDLICTILLDMPPARDLIWRTNYLLTTLSSRDSPVTGTVSSTVCKINYGCVFMEALLRY